MGLFSNIFGKKQESNNNGIIFEFIDNGFIINGHSFSIPARASEVIKVLGEPRVVEHPCPGKLKEIYSEKYGFDINTFQPLDYYWDEYGLFAFTFDHETIHKIAICLQPNKAYEMPRKCFSGVFLIHGKPWQDEVVNHNGGALQFDQCCAMIYGNTKKAKTVLYLDYKKKSDEIEFFEITEEVKKILSFASAETAIQQSQTETEKSDIYIMEKYWNHYIGDSDDSISLVEYLADKKSNKIKMKDVFSDLGFDKADFDFRKPKEPITISLKGGLEIELHCAIQVLCDLAAILLECKKNNSVDLQELSGGILEADKVSVSLTSTDAEDKVLLEILDDFCKSPMEYNLREMCEKDELEEMSSICNNLRNELDQ